MPIPSGGGGGKGKCLTPEEKCIVDSWCMNGEQLKANREVYIPDLKNDPRSLWLEEQVHVRDVGSTLGYNLERYPENLRSVLFSEYNKDGSTIHPRDIQVNPEIEHPVQTGTWDFNTGEVVEFTLPPTENNYILNGMRINLQIVRDFDVKVEIKCGQDLMRKFTIPASAGDVYNVPFRDFAEMAVYKGEVFTIKMSGLKPNTLGGTVIDEQFIPVLYCMVQTFEFFPLATQDYVVEEKQKVDISEGQNLKVITNNPEEHRVLFNYVHMIRGATTNPIIYSSQIMPPEQEGTFDLLFTTDSITLDPKFSFYIENVSDKVNFHLAEFEGIVGVYVRNITKDTVLRLCCEQIETTDLPEENIYLHIYFTDKFDKVERNLFTSQNKIDSSFITSSGGGETTYTFELSENMTAGDVVEIINDGRIKTIKGREGSSIAFGSIEQIAEDAARMFATAMDNDTVLISVCYDNTSPRQGVIYLAKIINNQVDLRNQVVFTDRAAWGIKPIRLTDTTFIVCGDVKTVDGSDYEGIAKAGIIDGDGIYLGDEARFATGDIYPVVTVPVGTTKAVVNYKVPNTKKMYARILYINPNNLTVTPSASIQIDSAMDTYLFDAMPLTSDTYILLTQDAYTTDNFRLRKIKIDGSAFVLGNTYTIDVEPSSANIKQFQALTKIDDTSFMLYWRDAGVRKVKIMVCNVSNTAEATITYDKNKIAEVNDAMLPEIVRLTDTKFLLTYQGEGTNTQNAVWFTVNGRDINFYYETVEITVTGNDPKDTEYVAPGKVLFLYKKSNTSSPSIDLSQVMDVDYEFNAEKRIGILQEDGNAGDTKIVKLLNQDSDIHSGLIPGETYYVDDTGKITSNNTGYPIGIALNSTTLKLLRG